MSRQYEGFEIDPKTRTRLVRVIIIVLILLTIFAFSASLLRLYTNYIWFSVDAEAPEVFLVEFRTRLLLFAIGFVSMAILFSINLKFALSALASMRRIPMVLADVFVQGFLDWCDRNSKRVIKVGGFISGLLFGLSLAGAWEKWLLFSNATEFGRKDPIFSNDFSFYVFQLDFCQSIVSWLMSVWFFSCVIAGVGAFLALAISTAQMKIAIPQMSRTHLSILAGVGFILFALQVWYGRFDALSTTNVKFTGAGHADLQAITMKNIVVVSLVISAIIAIINIKKWPAFIAIGASAGVTILIYLLGVIIYPSIVQTYQVNPNEFRMQQQYIGHAINTTRWAYALDRIEDRPFNIVTNPDPSVLKNHPTILKNMRLWDPFILQRNIEIQQALRDYYTFQDIDVDRYVINDDQRMVMIGARDLSVNKLDPARRSWQNLRLQYTHGNGVVAAAVNTATPEGMPIYFLKDVPPAGVPEMTVTQSRIYYSDLVDENGMPSDRYVFVRTRVPELDYSPTGDAEHRWEGDGGIPMSSFWHKFVFSIVLGDRDLFFSNDITEESRLLWRRGIRVRAASIFPFLMFDRDPYIAIINERLVWIMDAYTIAENVPYSEITRVGRRTVNYIRNSVKITIDAYTGEWNAYITEPDDPVIQCYQKIYPKLLKSFDEMPKEIVSHLRYPEDIFTIQTAVLERYHITEPLTFYRGENAWEVPTQTGAGNQGVRMSPYYVQIKLPDEARDAFMLMLPFTPVGRPNLSGWLAAQCDPDDYGKMILYRFPRDRTVFGPEQQEAKLEAHAPLSKEITLLSQVGSRIISGNLLVVPVGDSVIYVKTYFLEASRQNIRAIPELKLVAIIFGDRVVHASSYTEALAMIMGDIQEASTVAGEEISDEVKTEQPRSQSARDIAIEALRILEEAERALQQNDWSRYGDAQKRLKQLLERNAGGQN